MTNDIESLLPQRVRNAVLYDPKRSEIIYDLSDNTSQWSMAPGVKDRIKELDSDPSIYLSRYPEIYADSLKEALAKDFIDYLPSGTDNIVIGCGTDDVLDCIIRSCTQAGDTVITPIPTFPMAGYFSKYNDRNVYGIELDIDGSLDVEKYCSIESKLIYLCSPNNPTGTVIPRDNLDELLTRYTGFIVIDEAYAEFSLSHNLDLLLTNPRVIVMRTFSKLHALAGLRIGYGFADERVINAIQAVRGPYKANTVAIQAALASLSQATWHKKVVNDVRDIRQWFIQELSNIGLTALDSDVNFVYIPMKIYPDLKQRFTDASIAVRIFDEDLGVVGTGLRITIGPKAIMYKVLDVLKSINYE